MKTFGPTTFLCLLLLVTPLAACKSEPPPKPQPVIAKIAHQPTQPGDSLRVTMQNFSVLGKAPGADLKKIGVFRPIAVNNEIETTFVATLEERGPELVRWRLEFEKFDNVLETSSSKTASTDYALTGRTFLWEKTPEGEKVTAVEGEPATQSQTEVLQAIGPGLERRDAWGKFLSTREFEQSKIVEAPAGLFLGGLVRAGFGEVAESHTTLSLFRLGQENGNEIAFFDLDSNLETAVQDEAYYELVVSGKAVVRIVDGAILRYELDGKVTPRAPSGEMLPSGSGRWQVAYVVDPASIETTQK